MNYLYAREGEELIPGPNYGAIASGKNLTGKIAGNDKAEHILGGEFFGWTTGMDEDPTPEELVDYFLTQLHEHATDGEVGQVNVVGDVLVDIQSTYVTAEGLDLKELTQKFLWGAITYSQGTADYLKTDFSQNNVEPDDEGKPYTTAEHKWDEAFGY